MKTINKTSVLLRDYQQSLVQKIYEAWADGKKKVIAQLPVGAGKTICFAQIAKDFALKKEGVLVLAHRQELIEQATAKIIEATGLEVGIIKNGVKPNYSAPIQVASVQSLGSRLSHLGSIGLVICDEAHHSVAKSWRSILSHFPDQYILGVTATPIRLDGSGFIDQYDVLIQGASVQQLMGGGVLSQYKLYAAPQAMSTESVKKQNGDYSISDLAKQNNIIELSGHLIESYRRHANRLQAVVFAINIEHSKAIADRYKQEGITAAHLDGKTPAKERSETIAAFRRGEIKILTNCNLFDEGFDLPSLGCVQIARPTQSLSKYMQMLGRGARSFEGKEYAIYIDHTQNYLIHGLPDASREWSLDGVKSDLRPIGQSENNQITQLADIEEEDRERKAIVELSYVVLERVRRVEFPPDIVERYLANPSATQLAKEIGCSKDSLLKHIRSLGVEVINPSAKKEFPPDIVERYLANPNASQLAKELGCSQSAVLDHLRMLGVGIIGSRSRINIPSNLVEKYKAEPSATKIAKEIGCVPKVVLKHLRRMGVQIKAGFQFPSDVADRYALAPNLSTLSKEIGCSIGELRRHLEFLGIEINSSGSKRLPEDTVQKYIDDPNLSKLAKELKTTPPTLKKYLESCGVAVVRPTRKDFPADIVARYADGASASKLAKEYGVFTADITYHLRSLGVEIRRPNAKQDFPCDIAERYKSNPNVKRLAKELGYGEAALWKHLRSLGIDTRKKPKNP
jgi:superfamily II DNA or RNA helicase/biotin operon repressor